MNRIEKDVKVTGIDSEIFPMYRITLKKNDKFFGPGVSTLLHYIEDLKSIQAACQKMGMSYSKAWNIIKFAESELGYKLLDTKSGGQGGGLSVLTDKCKKFLRKYDMMMNELNDYTKMVYTKYFNS